MFKYKSKSKRLFSKIGNMILENNVNNNIVINGKLTDALNGQWILRNNSKAEIDIDPVSSLISISGNKSKSVVYLRSVSELSYKKNEQVDCDLIIDTCSKLPLSLTVSFFSDKNLQLEIVSSKFKAKINGTKQEFNCRVQADYSGNLYVLIQINFPSNDLKATVEKIRALVVDSSIEFSPIRFGMRSFGPYEKASARLRCWKIAESLKKFGHVVSMNSDATSDVYFYQKVRDLKHFKGVTSKESRLLVFDFDDNYFMPNKGNPAEFLSFMNQMDIVTVGSNYLYNIAKDYHPNLIILENPVDINNENLCKTNFSWENKIGWFGAPENVLQLKLVDYPGKVTTITRLGDIEFDIYKVDEQLIEFDLLLFPLEITEWNAAKNANRMIKAVSLGVPVLASATPEHIRVAKEFGLNDDFLVFKGDSWQEKITHLKNKYEKLKEVCRLARNKSLKIYCADTISHSLLERLFEIGKRDPLNHNFSTDKFSTTALINTSFSIVGEDFELLLESSEVNFNSFSSVNIFSDFISENKIIAYQDDIDFTLDTNPLNLYQKMEDFINSTEDDFILFVDSNVSLLKPVIKNISFEYDVLGIDLTIFEGSLQCFPKNNLEAYQVLLDKKYPRALLVKTSWLRAKKIRVSEMLSFLSMAIWFEALICNETSVASTKLPLGVLFDKDNHPKNISNIFYSNILRNEPEFKAEVPNIENQWGRASHDIVQSILSRHPQAAASIAAKLLQSHYAQMAKRK